MFSTAIDLARFSAFVSFFHSHVKRKAENPTSGKSIFHSPARSLGRRTFSSAKAIPFPRSLSFLASRRAVSTFKSASGSTHPISSRENGPQQINFPICLRHLNKRGLQPARLAFGLREAAGGAELAGDSASKQAGVLTNPLTPPPSKRLFNRKSAEANLPKCLSRPSPAVLLQRERAVWLRFGRTFGSDCFTFNLGLPLRRSSAWVGEALWHQNFPPESKYSAFKASESWRVSDT